MAYSTATRVWYGPESYQHAMFYHPAGHNIGTAPAYTDGDPRLPVIVYRPGGGWAGADTDDMTISRIWWAYGLGDATSPHVDSYAVFVLNTASIGYNRTKSVGLTAWADATAYALGDYRSYGSRLWTCIDAHTSDLAGAVNVPGTGSSWEDFWREVSPQNETGLRKVPDLGECTPGGLDESVLNVQQFVAYLRRNYLALGINPDQICVAGASAGGQLVGCAAYAEDIAWARENQIHAASRHVPYTSTQPNALLLSITPVDLVRHTVYSLLNGLYGEDASDATWIAREAEIKQAMSPLYVLKRTGLAIPTCLDYMGQTAHTAGTSFAGITGAAYHAADNGWLLLQALTAAAPTGLGQTGHVFFDGASTPYSSWTSLTTTATATHATNQLAATAILDWLNTAMDV